MLFSRATGTFHFMHRMNAIPNRTSLFPLSLGKKPNVMLYVNYISIKIKNTENHV